MSSVCQVQTNANATVTKENTMMIVNPEGVSQDEKK